MRFKKEEEWMNDMKGKMNEAMSALCVESWAKFVSKLKKAKASYLFAFFKSNMLLM